MERMTRRWNGWGDDGVVAKIPSGAATLLGTLIGSPRPSPDATLADVVATMPVGRLPSPPLVTADPEDRVRHARWGDGTVVTSKLTRNDEEVTVAFKDPSVGRKTMLVSLANLEIIG